MITEPITHMSAFNMIRERVLVFQCNNLAYYAYLHITRI